MRDHCIVGKMSAKENTKTYQLKCEYLAVSNARRKYKDAPEERLKRGYQQREANYKGSEKEEEESRVSSGFSLTLEGPEKYKPFFIHCRWMLVPF